MENNINWKYILYETTNVVNNKIYIGVHQTEDPNKFDGYIGCGVYISQPYTYENAKTAFQFAVKKYGPDKFIRRTLMIFDSEDAAYEKEEEIVNEDFLKRSDVYNMILGGKAGVLKSQRIKVYQYDLTGKYLNEYESFAFAALQVNLDYTSISYAVKHKTKAANYFWNTDKVDSLDLSNYNFGDNHRISIYLYDLNGNYIKKFNSVAESVKELKISNSEIKEACLLGNCLKNKYYCCYNFDKKYCDARTIYIQNRPVYQYDGKTGKFIMEYKTQLEAEKRNKNSNISKAIRLKSIDSNGFIWGLEKLENYNIPINKRAKRKVGKYDLNGNLIKTYESATAAEKENGTSIWKVLNGTNKTHKQHVYKYIIC